MELTKEQLDTAKDILGDDLAVRVWNTKYRLEDETSPTEMFNRVTDTLWKCLKPKLEKLRRSEVVKSISGLSEYLKSYNKDSLYNDISKFVIIPGGSMLSGLGSGKPISLSNCFVISSPEDSYPSIIATEMIMSELCKRRGGVGIDLSKIRPNGAKVNNAARTSTGVIPFLDSYSHRINEIAQNGRKLCSSAS